MMEINVLAIPSEGLEISREVGLEEWNLAEKGIFLLEPIDFTLRLIEHAKRDIYLTGRLTTSIQMECSRCLKNISLSIRSSFHLEYVPFPDSDAEEDALSAEALDLMYYRGETILLNEGLMEQLFLSVPTHPICQSECLGLCPQCGGELNEARCECNDQSIDPRWSVLNNFKYKETHAKS